MEEARSLARMPETAAPREEPSAQPAAPSRWGRLIEEGRLRPESYPGEWDDLRRTARRRAVRGGIIGWSAAVMILAMSACTTTVAVTAGGLVGYAGYSIYRLAEAGRSWTAAAYEFLFTAKKTEPPAPAEPKKDAAPSCALTDRVRGRC